MSTPIFTQDATAYYETRISTNQDIKDCIELCNNYLPWQPVDNPIKVRKNLRKITPRTHRPPVSQSEIHELLKEEHDSGEYELWLLYHYSRQVVRWTNQPRPYPTYDPEALLVGTGAPLPTPTEESASTPKYGRGYGLPCRVPDCFLILETTGEPGKALRIAATALCRDPWADVAPVVQWFKQRSLDLSEALGGASEILIHVGETDLPLQLALREEGFFCWELDSVHEDLTFSLILEPVSQSCPSGPLARTPLAKRLRKQS